MTAVRARPVEPVVDLTDGVPLLDLRDDPAAPPPAPTPAPAPERSGHRLRRLWFLPAGVALLGAAALVPSVGGGGPGPGEARLDVSGTAVVTTADGQRRTVRDDRTDVGPGDEVEVTAGTTRFEMADGVRLEGRAGPAGDGREGTTVTMAIAPRLVAGQLLAIAPRPLEVRAGDTRVMVRPASRDDGVARLDQRIGLAVGSYAGAVTVASAGRDADVPDLRRIDVAAPGAVGDTPQPLRYDPADPWDRRYLADALAIDAQLAPLLAGAGARADAFLDADALAAAVGLDSARGLPTRVGELDDGADALVLAAIAAAADGRSVGPAWDAAAAFHADGAPWGLVGLDQGARAERVLALVRGALDTLDLSDAAPVGAETERPSADAASGTDADPAATPTDAAATPDGSAAGPGATTPGTTPTAPGTDPTDPGGGGGSTPALPAVPAPTVPGVPSVPTPTLPPVTTPPISTPPISTPPIAGLPPITVPPIVVPPITVPPLPVVDDVVDVVGGIIGGLGTGLGTVLAPTP